MRKIDFMGRRKGGTEWLVGDIVYVDGKPHIFPRNIEDDSNGGHWYEVVPSTVRTVSKSMATAAWFVFLAILGFLTAAALMNGDPSPKAMAPLDSLRAQNDTLRSQRDEALRIVEQQDSFLVKYDLLMECLSKSVAYPCNVQGCVGGLVMIEEWTENDKTR